jgi:hypothetical protein
LAGRVWPTAIAANLPAASVKFAANFIGGRHPAGSDHSRLKTTWTNMKKHPMVV